MVAKPQLCLKVILLLQGLDEDSEKFKRIAKVNTFFQPIQNTKPLLPQS